MSVMGIHPINNDNALKCPKIIKKSLKQVKRGLCILNHDTCLIETESLNSTGGRFSISANSKTVFIVNGGLTTGADYISIMEYFVSSGFKAIESIVMVPGKQYSFVVFSNELEANEAVQNLSGVKSLGLHVNKSPLYMTCINKAPRVKNCIKYELPPGLKVCKDFITLDEEKTLANLINWKAQTLNSSEGTVLKHREVRHFGYEFKYASNSIDKCELEQKIPDELIPICERMVDMNFIKELPDQLTVNRYLPGQGIPPHVDTHSSFTDVILSLSILGGVSMDFRCEHLQENRQHLQENCLSLQRKITNLQENHENLQINCNDMHENHEQFIHNDLHENHKHLQGNHKQLQDDHKQENCEYLQEDGKILPDNHEHSQWAGTFNLKNEADFPASLHYSVYLPARSLCVMTGESRYLWTHGICPRKTDVVPCPEGPGQLALKQRSERISFTFRKIRKETECDCSFPRKCDSKLRREKDVNSLPINSKTASDLEKEHVLKVYEEIAPHFSQTRHKPWPKVLQFVQSLPCGSLMLDVGCGNGKYLGHNKYAFQIGSDTSGNLLDICKEKFEVVRSNCLSQPFRNCSFDSVICIAVIHHLASQERRLKAIEEILRVLRDGGVCLIYVWAMEQRKGKASAYLRQKRSNRRAADNKPASLVSFKESEIKIDEMLSIHPNKNEEKLSIHQNKNEEKLSIHQNKINQTSDHKNKTDEKLSDYQNLADETSDHKNKADDRLSVPENKTNKKSVHENRNESSPVHQDKTEEKLSIHHNETSDQKNKVDERLSVHKNKANERPSAHQNRTDERNKVIVDKAIDSLPIHENRTDFLEQDLFVPWKIKPEKFRRSKPDKTKTNEAEKSYKTDKGDRTKTNETDNSDKIETNEKNNTEKTYKTDCDKTETNETGNTEKSDSTEKGDSTDERDRTKIIPVYHRFYHVFKEGELDDLISSFHSVEILDSYYDEGNWCVLFKKIRQSI